MPYDPYVTFPTAPKTVTPEFLAEALEYIMAAIDDLKAENTAIKARLVTLGEEISQQIQQLQDALGDQAAVAEVAADLQTTGAALDQFITSLQADDAPEPPEPVTP